MGLTAGSVDERGAVPLPALPVNATMAYAAKSHPQMLNELLATSHVGTAAEPARDPAITVASVRDAAMARHYDRHLLESGHARRHRRCETARRLALGQPIAIIPRLSRWRCVFATHLLQHQRTRRLAEIHELHH